MRRLLLLLVALGGLAACNARRLGLEAPELVGSQWLQTSADVVPETAGRWILVEFFAPT